MRQYIGARVAPLAVAGMLVIAIAACGGEKKASDQPLAQDSTLGRDLAMAAHDSAVQPQLKDVPTTPPPVEAPPPPKTEPALAPKPKTKPPVSTPPAAIPAPTPVALPVPVPPPKAEPVTGDVAAGTTLRFTTNSKVCSNTNMVGDKFTGALSQSVPASNGIEIPSGATGTFEITEAKTAKNSGDKTVLTVKLIAVQYGGKSYPVDATLQTASTERVRSATKGTDAKKVAGGAIIGAIAGQIIGKNTKGTVIGAAAGAAAGTAAAVATADFDTCLNGGGEVVVKLDGPITVRMAPVP